MPPWPTPRRRVCVPWRTPLREVATLSYVVLLAPPAQRRGLFNPTVTYRRVDSPFARRTKTWRIHSPPISKAFRSKRRQSSFRGKDDALLQQSGAKYSIRVFRHRARQANHRTASGSGDSPRQSTKTVSKKNARMKTLASHTHIPLQDTGAG